jgi:glyoxylase-like metal-dependent hydrolase (beta-lactamase superfamily II)
MDVLQIAPGLWRWTGYHEEWKQDVGSVYDETEDGVVLIDPIVPPEDATRFWSALDRDVDAAGGTVHVLVTVYWHTRHAREMVERYSGRVWAPERGKQAIARRAGAVTDPFGEDDRLPGGVEAFRTVRGNEVVYWLPQHRALVPGDVLLGDRDGGIRLCPQSWLGQSRTQTQLAESLRPLLELPVERVLLSHGQPVLKDAHAALAAVLA